MGREESSCRGTSACTTRKAGKKEGEREGRGREEGEKGEGGRKQRRKAGEGRPKGSMQGRT